MSATNWLKNKRIYYLSFVVIIAVAALLVLTFRGVFSAVSTAYELDYVVQDSELRIDKDNLEAAYKIYYEREIPKLNVR